MKIVIIGGGKVGFTIARQLTREGHSVTVVDPSPAVAEAVTESLDAMAICGNGANLDVLCAAEAQKSDLLIACTAGDEFNLLCCVFAKKLGCRSTIARVRTPEYVGQMYYLKDELGLSMTINPELIAAREIFSLMEIPGVLRRDSFAKSRVEIVELKVAEGSVLDGLQLPEFQKKLRCRALICAVVRNGSVIIPDGRCTLASGDRIYVCARLTEIVRMLDSLGESRQKLRSAMIIGGSKVADYLTGLLLEAGTDVKVIERRREKAEDFALRYPKAQVVCADGASEEVLRSERAEKMDAVAAVTNLDEENILLSMYLSHLGVPQVISKVNRGELSSLMAERGGVKTVSPKKLCADAIVGYVRSMQNTGGSSVLTMHHLVDGRVEALEFNVTAACRRTGIMLKDLDLKPDILIACINRLGRVIVPGGMDSLEAGDTVIVISSADKVILDLDDIFAEA